MDLFINSTREYVYDYYDKNGVPKKEGLDEILKYLKEKGYKIAVASSSRRQSVIHHLKDANIEDYFDAIISGDMIKRSKPKPDIYLEAAKVLNVRPKDCYALEDSPNGIKSAKNANMTTVMIPDLIKPNEELKKMVDYEFNDLNEFLKFLIDKHN